MGNQGNWERKDQLIERMKARGTRKNAIDAKCVDCIFDPAEPGNWRQQVSACGCVSCPLYEFRPQSKGATQ